MVTDVFLIKLGLNIMMLQAIPSSYCHKNANVTIHLELFYVWLKLHVVIGTWKLCNFYENIYYENGE